MKKEAQGTTALESIQGLKTQVKTMLDNLTPMMQGLQNSIPQLNAALQQIQQLETQISQLEQIKGKVQEVTQTTQQTADDKPKDSIEGGKGDDIPESKLNKKQLDMGQKVEMEHTNDPELAREIARDHLSEELKDGKEKDKQEYYTKLKQIHDDSCKDYAWVLDLSGIIK